MIHWLNSAMSYIFILILYPCTYMIQWRRSELEKVWSWKASNWNMYQKPKSIRWEQYGLFSLVWRKMSRVTDWREAGWASTPLTNTVYPFLNPYSIYEQVRHMKHGSSPKRKLYVAQPKRWSQLSIQLFKECHGKYQFSV